MPVDVFEMNLAIKLIRRAEPLAQQDGVIHLLHVLARVRERVCTALPPTCVV